MGRRRRLSNFDLCSELLVSDTDRKLGFQELKRLTFVVCLIPSTLLEFIVCFFILFNFYIRCPMYNEFPIIFSSETYWMRRDRAYARKHVHWLVLKDLQRHA